MIISFNVNLIILKLDFFPKKCKSKVILAIGEFALLFSPIITRKTVHSTELKQTFLVTISSPRFYHLAKTISPKPSRLYHLIIFSPIFPRFSFIPLCNRITRRADLVIGKNHKLSQLNVQYNFNTFCNNEMLYNRFISKEA